MVIMTEAKSQVTVDEQYSFVRPYFELPHTTVEELTMRNQDAVVVPENEVFKNKKIGVLICTSERYKYPILALTIADEKGKSCLNQLTKLLHELEVIKKAEIPLLDTRVAQKGEALSGFLVGQARIFDQLIVNVKEMQELLERVETKSFTVEDALSGLITKNPNSNKELERDEGEVAVATKPKMGLPDSNEISIPDNGFLMYPLRLKTSHDSNNSDYATFVYVPAQNFPLREVIHPIRSMLDTALTIVAGRDIKIETELPLLTDLREKLLRQEVWSSAKVAVESTINTDSSLSKSEVSTSEIKIGTSRWKHLKDTVHTAFKSWLNHNWD